MAGQVLGTPLRSGKFFDTIGSGASYFGAMYNCVSALNATEAVSFPHAIEYSPDGAGIKMTNVSNSVALVERVKGIAVNSAQSGTPMAYRTGPGIANVMAGAAITREYWVAAALNEQKIDSSAPALNLADIKIPVDPRFSVTYSLAMIEAVAPVVANSGPNNLNVFGIGVADAAAVNKYDIIPVDLFLMPFYS